MPVCHIVALYNIVSRTSNYIPILRENLTLTLTDIKYIPIFEFAVTADYNDKGFNLYSLSLSMKLNIPKFQCSFALLTTVCIVEGVTFCSLTFTF